MYPLADTTTILWTADNPMPVQPENGENYKPCSHRSFSVEGCSCHHYHPRTTSTRDTSSFQRFTTCMNTRPVQIIDLSKIPPSELFVPSPSGQKQLCLEFLQAARQNLFEAYISNPCWLACPGVSPLEKHHTELFRACSELETFLPTLANLGEKLSTRLTPEVKKALIDRHTTCPMETTHDGRYCERVKSFCLLRGPYKGIKPHIYGQQTLTTPCYQAWIAAEKISKGKVLDKLLTEELIKAGFTHANPQIFIGLIHKHFADPIANKQMFMEDTCSRFVCHGPRSHLIQVLALARAGKLTPELLDWLITSDSWSYWLDCDIQALPAQITPDTQKRIVLFNGLAACLTGKDPANLHLLLLQKTLSQAADEILKCGDNDRKQRFLKVLGIPPSSTPEIWNQQLSSLKNSLSLLEAYTIESQYRGIAKAKRTGLEMDNVQSFNFEDSADHEFTKARHYLSKGYQVTAITHCDPTSKLPKTINPGARTFSSLEDFDAWLKETKTKPYLEVGFIIDKQLGENLCGKVQ